MNSIPWIRWLFAQSLAWLACACASGAGDCRSAGTCECRNERDCPDGKYCVDGRCQDIVGPAVLREFGEVCAFDAQCRSGLCLPPGPGNGGVCTRECQAGCPDGWDCRTRWGTGEKPLDLCVQHIEPRLCQACAVDGQCNAAGDLCLAIGDARACGLDCRRDPCPPGTECRDVPLPAGTARQCLPLGDSCECGEATRGLTRACQRTGSAGTCHGHEVCAGTPPAWTECDATEPAPEVCDGRDNDCDGLTDAADPSVDHSGLPGDLPFPACAGTGGESGCAGQWACLKDESGDFAWTCVAPDTAPEVCNGFDDDCDGATDEDFRDGEGRYLAAAHCGGCGVDCLSLLSDLEADASGKPLPDAAGCEVRDGTPVCVPLKCRPGTYPYPESRPLTCAELRSPQCEMCSQDGDCRISTDACLPLPGEDGLYCLQSCEPASFYDGCTGQIGVRSCCPQGHLCQDVGGRLRCVPQGGSCTCNAEKIGDRRPCFLAGGDQQCQGEQRCEQPRPGVFAWGECAAAEVVAEVCDGLDNNCDGRVDEGFVDAQGRYFTDAHCGRCHHDCRAQWDPDTQHAIGGCREQSDGSFDCEIVACTTRQVEVFLGCDAAGGGTGICRREDDCTHGLECDFDLHWCVLDGSGECPCAMCGAPPDYTFQYVDQNGIDADGCECAADARQPIDEPDVFAAYPAPDEIYLDRNCDGVDGMAAGSLFVRAGEPGGDGSRARPFGTIGQALAVFDAARHTSILVATGRYPENIALKLGARLYGGYAADFSRRNVVLFPSQIAGSEPTAPGAHPGTVYGANLRGRRTILSGFTIQGYDVNADPAPGGAGNSSYAVFLQDCDGTLEVTNNLILGGRGGDGAGGVSGASGRSGGGGGRGQDSWECAGSSDCAGMTRAGGGGGVNPACPAARGNDGATARDYFTNPQQYAGGGLDGRGGTNSIYDNSGIDWTLCKYDCQVDSSQDGCNGQDAQNGGEGLDGLGGAGCAAPSGSVSGGVWRPASAGTGGAGQAGSGGGGGGAGGAVINYNAGTGCTVGNPFGDLGGSGGGGGAGGCGAAGGGSGGGGGGSFGVFLGFSSAPASLPAVRGNRIRRGPGGAGGDGGGGGQGGLGGAGGDGGDIRLPAWCAGAGGRGGRGGDGGAGGGGGGGCGGVSFGIGGNFLAGAPYEAQNIFESPADPDTGGPGGAGGFSPAGAGGAGGAGRAGASGNVGRF